MTSHTNSDDLGSGVTQHKHAVVFANQKAGGGNPSKLLPKCEEVFRNYGISLDVRTTSSLENLEEQARKALADDAKLLFALGGDGTLQGLVNAVFGQDVILGVIPAGGGNDFARALELPKDPITALKAALDGEVRKVDLAQVRLGTGRERLFLGGGGIGLDADAAKFSGSRFQNWPGRTRYVASAICAFVGFQPRRVRVTMDSQSKSAACEISVLSCVLNTPTFGAGIRLAPSARIDDGLLDFVFLEKLSLGRLLLALPQLALKGTLDLPGLRTLKFHKICIESEAPAYFQGDGELLGPTPVEIEVVPNAARFLAPKRKAASPFSCPASV